MAKELPVANKDKKYTNLKIVDSTKPVLYTFVPQCSWFDENFQSIYTKNMLYYVRAGNNKLHAAVQDWKTLGMVTTGK